jgi:hypothetical protein
MRCMPTLAAAGATGGSRPGCGGWALAMPSGMGAGAVAAAAADADAGADGGGGCGGADDGVTAHQSPTATKSAAPRAGSHIGVRGSSSAAPGGAA